MRAAALSAAACANHPPGEHVAFYKDMPHPKGTYVCACCGHKLFPGDTKFDSGSGCASRPVPAHPAPLTPRRAQSPPSGAPQDRTRWKCGK